MSFTHGKFKNLAWFYGTNQGVLDQKFVKKYQKDTVSNHSKSCGLRQIVGSRSICSKISSAAELSLFLTAVAKSNPSFTASGVRSFTLSRFRPSFFILSPSAHDFQLSDMICSATVSGSRRRCLQSVSSIFPRMSSSF